MMDETKSKQISDASILSQVQFEDMLNSTDDCRVVVASLNRKTGEYRLIVQGTLNKHELMRE